MKHYDEMPPVPRDETLDVAPNQMRRLVETLGRLRSEKRKRLLEVLDRQPGLNIDELAQALGVRRTAAIHHLRRLEKQITIVRVRQGRHVLHFLGSLPPPRRQAICLSRVPSIRRIVEDLAQNPQYSQEAVAERVGVSRRTVRRAIRRLLQGKLIELWTGEGHRTQSVRLSADIASSAAAPSPKGVMPAPGPVAPSPPAAPFARLGVAYQ